MSTLLLIVTDEAKREAARTYGAAVDRHFEEANRLLREGKPDAAERIAKGAAALRMDARFELVVS